jgi:hypothetical protein
MEITSNNPELGDAKEEIEVEYKGGRHQDWFQRSLHAWMF